MKKVLFAVLCSLAAISFASCQKQDIDSPDGKAAFESLIITKSLNTFLSKDLNVLIDGDTLRFPLPAGLEDTTVVVNFKLTKGDAITIDGAAVDGDTFAITPNDTTLIAIVVEDADSKISTSYSYCLIENDEKAELLGIAFNKSDNEKLLSADYAPNEITSDISLAIPKEVIGQMLVATISSSLNDVVKINGESVSSDGKISIDTSFPVDIEIDDIVAGESVKYVLRFSKTLTSWVVADSFGSVKVDSWMHMAMGSKYPYVCYLIDNADSTVVNMVSLKKYNGKSFEQVGEERFSAGKSTAAYVAVNSKDVPFVYYVDGTVSSKLSARTFNGNTWVNMGTDGWGAKTTGLLSQYKMAFAINGATGYPVAVNTANAALSSTGVQKRGASVSIWDGSAWDADKPINGRTQVYSYTPRIASCADGFYVLECNQTEKTYSLYKNANKVWSTVVDNFSLGGSDLGTTSVAAHCDSKGTCYAALADASTGSWLCNLYKVNGNKFEKFNNTIPAVTFGNTSAIFDFAFDKNDNPVLAYITEDLHLKVISIDPDTKTWGQAYDFGDGFVGGYLGIGINSDNEIYVAAVRNHGETKGYDIILYKGIFSE